MLLTLLRGIDAVPIPVTTAAHDAIFATTSNLPHLFAYCLRHVYDRLGEAGADKTDFVCPSFYGATRIAASDPEMVFQMLWYNRANLSNSLATLLEKLRSAQEALDTADQKAFRQIFDLEK
ncbi:MAG: prephenate dehydrogenase dimerization domain-containing protein [bacterium]